MSDEPILGLALTDGKSPSGPLMAIVRVLMAFGDRLDRIAGRIEGLVARAPAAGPRGEAGPPGVPGPRGEVGIPGPPGERGERGDAGRDGRDGRDGRSVQRIWLDDLGRGHAELTDGTEIVLGSLVGPAGPKGDLGDTGDTGPAGPRGPAGEAGAVGPAGRAGPEGPRGHRGHPGEPGAPGADGSTIELGYVMGAGLTAATVASIQVRDITIDGTRVRVLVLV